EDVVKQKCRSFYRGKAFKQDKKRHCQRLRHFEPRAGCNNRLGQPLSNVNLPARARGPELIDAEPGDGGREESLRRTRFGFGCLVSQECFLNGILRIRAAAEHTIGNRHQKRTVFVECFHPIHTASACNARCRFPMINRAARYALAKTASTSIPSCPTQSPVM